MRQAIGSMIVTQYCATENLFLPIPSASSTLGEAQSRGNRETHCFNLPAASCNLPAGSFSCKSCCTVGVFPASCASSACKAETRSE